MLYREFFFGDVPQEQGIPDDIPAPHAPRLFDQAIQPFQSLLLPPDRSTFHRTRKEVEYRSDSSYMSEGKLLINTINAHSYNTALKDAGFAEALLKGGALIPDGASMVLAFRWLRKESIERTAGWDLFEYEMERLNRKGGICYFLGSSKNTLKLIKEKAKTVYPNIRIETYSPPYKPEFTEEENQMMIDAYTPISLVWEPSCLSTISPALSHLWHLSSFDFLLL